MVREPKKEKIKVLSLGKLLSQAETQEDIQDLTDLLSSFSCDKDKDIERFLHNRAIEFEHLNKGRTYLLCDNENFYEKGQFVILGYFTIALKVLDLPDELSNRKRKDLDGLSAKLHGDVIRSIPCYLIGQLAKNSNIPKKQAVKGSELIDCALAVIQSAETLVGGRYVMIECHNIPELLRLYTENGFEKFAEKPYEDEPMVQMVRMLCSPIS